MRSLALCLVSGLLLAGCGGDESDGSLPRPGPPLVKVSAATPFASGCADAPASSTVYRDAEVEPHLAVDPSNPSRLLGAWQQDRFADGGARGLVTARSSDGGVTWARTMLPASRCGGGHIADGSLFDRASDPWVAFGADGRAYAIALAFDQSAASADNAILVFRSTDGGASWGAATTLIRDDVTAFNDKEAMAADPGDWRYAYASWDRLTSDDRGPAMFARTIDGGATWEAARVVHDPGVGNQTLNVTPVVAADGTLYLHFTEILRSATSESLSLRVMRSTDHGATFDPPQHVTFIFPFGAYDPGNGDPIRDGAGLGNMAVGPSGELVIVWQEPDLNAFRDTIHLMRSTDGGATWPVRRLVGTDHDAQAFTPAVAVRADGRIGVTYFDMRDDDQLDGPLSVTHWLSTTTIGAPWVDTRVSQPFDIRLAPVARGLFLGDYMGLVVSGSSFVPFFTQTNNRGTTDRTDVYTLPVGTLTAVATTAAEPSTKPGAARVPSVDDRRRAYQAVMRTLAARVPDWEARQARFEAAARAARPIG